MIQQQLRHEYQSRRERVSEIASLRGFDGILVVGRSPDRAGDLAYLCGHKPFLSGHTSRYTLRGRGYGALLITPNPADAPTLVCTTPFYIEPTDVDDIEINPDFPKAVADVLRRRGIANGTVGLVGIDVLTVLLWEDLCRLSPATRFVEADDTVASMRAVKSDFEIELLRHGAAMADEVAEAVREHLVPGVTEREIGSFIVSELTKRGVAGAFATCQSGPIRSNEPYFDPPVSDRVMEEGDLVHMEFNGNYHGYLIDICRSACIGGGRGEQQRILETTLHMLESSVAAIKPGVPAEELERIAGEIAIARGYGENFTFAYGGAGTYLGHGIGLGVDEPPILAKGDKTLLQAGMVLTIEPGLYRTAVGGCRIEDEVLVTEEGVELLTTVPRKWW